MLLVCVKIQDLCEHFFRFPVESNAKAAYTLLISLTPAKLGRDYLNVTFNCADLI